MSEASSTGGDYPLLTQAPEVLWDIVAGSSELGDGLGVSGAEARRSQVG